MKRQVCQAKRMYEVNIADNWKKIIQSFLNYINKRKEKKSWIGPLTDSVGKPVTENWSYTLAEQFFFSVFDIANSNTSTININDINMNDNPVYTLPDFVIPTSEVLPALQISKTNKSPRSNNFYSLLLIYRNKKRNISISRYTLFNLFLRKSKVPSNWKS